jgi:23S rRNA pseudouridine2604 synthase
MCEYLGYSVKELKRVRIMNINLDVGAGEWRYFTKKELTKINKTLLNSSKTVLEKK